MGQISGPAISHFFQVPSFFWTLLVGFIGALELNRAQIAFVPPPELGPDEAGKMRADHYPGDIGFDPLGLKPRTVRSSTSWSPRSSSTDVLLCLPLPVSSPRRLLTERESLSTLDSKYFVYFEGLYY